MSTRGTRPTGTVSDVVEHLEMLDGSDSPAWPGLRVYRCSTPHAWRGVVSSPSLCCVVRGRVTIDVDGQGFGADPSHYVVVRAGAEYIAKVDDTSTDGALLGFVLRLGSSLVSEVSADMGSEFSSTPGAAVALPASGVWESSMTADLAAAVSRFVKALTDDGDRRVLGPLYQREIVYRLLQQPQSARVLDSTSDVALMAPVIAYARAHLTSAISVSQLAAQVSMSPSGFAHTFRAQTGVSPYRFVKDMRLDQARILLSQNGGAVSGAARAVGYTSVSHFAAEFKRRYGVSPGDFRKTGSGLNCGSCEPAVRRADPMTRDSAR